ncbi:hypothetical protein HYALB_00014014 [Hymenoscyphus albidus]|uniref:Uncharacterized protein n=1 Tax=Hymenoscyphus albidus TaxID=595503 RepID=A0A9N9M2Y1_9HELO|nr:hypothetical protein HYALB_00014014 [Hymenoscyphus albidus]
MAFPPFFRKPRRKSSRGSDQAEESKTPQKRPTKARTPSHISLTSDWVTRPLSSLPSTPLPPASPKSIPVPQEDSSTISMHSSLSSWVTSPPSPPPSKVKLYSYMNHLSIPHLDQNICYILAHQEAIPDNLRAACFQNALRFWEEYILPSSAVKVWHEDITQAELEDLMIVGARLGHEYALPWAIRQRESYTALSAEAKKQKMAEEAYKDIDTCRDTTGDSDCDESDSDEEVPLSASYQHLLGNRDPFDLPISWGRAFGRDLVLRESFRPTTNDIEDEDYDALEGAYPDFKRAREEAMELEMGRLGWSQNVNLENEVKGKGKGKESDRENYESPTVKGKEGVDFGV